MLIYYISTVLKKPCELQRKFRTADRRVLGNQPNELVIHGLVDKDIFDTKVPKVEYELTGLRKSLLPIILNLES